MKKDFDFQKRAGEDEGPQFDYDPGKSRANKEKHGVDFEEALQIWDGPIAVIRSTYADEARSLVVGRIKDKFWSAVITIRNETIRIISVRRSRETEGRIWRNHYEP